MMISNDCLQQKIHTKKLKGRQRNQQSETNNATFVTTKMKTQTETEITKLQNKKKLTKCVAV